MNWSRLALIVVILLLAGVAVVGYLALDASRFKDDLLAFVDEEWGYEIEVGGEFELTLMPSVYLSAEDVRLVGGPPLIEEAGVSRVSVEIALLSLLRGPVEIRYVELSSARVVLSDDLRGDEKEQTSIGEARDALAEQELPFVVESARIDDFRVEVGDASATMEGAFGIDGEPGLSLSVRASGSDFKETLGLFGPEKIPAGPFDLSARLTGEDPPFLLEDIEASIGDLTGSGAGTVDFETLTLRGSISGASAEAFIQTWVNLELPPLPFELDGRMDYRYRDGALWFTGASGTIGEGIAVQVDGTVGNFIRAPFNFSTMELRVQTSGDDLRELLQRVRLPQRPLDYEGTARVRYVDGGAIVDEIDATIDGSVVKGEVVYERGDKSSFTADLRTELLDLTETFSFGVDDVLSARDDGRWIPVRDIGLAALGRVNLDMRIRADEVDLEWTLAHDVDAHIAVVDEVLSIDPLTTRIGDGVLTATATLDDSSERPLVAISLEGNQMRATAAGQREIDPALLPLMNVDISLSGTGTDLRELLGSADGHLYIEEGQGLIQYGPIRQLLGAINPPSVEQEMTNLTCYVVALDVNDGRIDSKAVAIETDELEIAANGYVDLSSEAMQLKFRIGEHDGVTTAKIISPLVQIGGTLGKPQIELEPGNTAVLILTEGWSLLINAFEQLSRADETICNASLRKAGLLE